MCMLCMPALATAKLSLQGIDDNRLLEIPQTVDSRECMSMHENDNAYAYAYAMNIEGGVTCAVLFTQ